MRFMLIYQGNKAVYIKKSDSINSCIIKQGRENDFTTLCFIFI